MTDPLVITTAAKVAAFLGLIVCGPTMAKTVLWRLRSSADRRRLTSTAGDDLALASEAIARTLASGLTLLQAVRSATEAIVGTPVAARLDRTLAEVDGGLSLVRAVERMTERDPLPELRLFSSAVAVTGGDLGARAAVFDRAAVTLRSRTAARAEATAQAAQARASAFVVGALPWLAVAALAVQGGEVAQVLFATSLGRCCLGAALTAELLGVRWMLSLARSATR
ncbi:MAG: tight adherence protein B [Candidatus Poriferisodalaceae bacterium]